MKNKVTTFIAVLGLFLILAVLNVSAQTPAGAQVNIPFDFSAGEANLKAGTYSIIRVSGSVLKFRNTDSKKTILVRAPLAIGSPDLKLGERLVFNRYGSEYYLTQVWLTVERGCQLLPSKAEEKAQELGRRQSTSPQRVEIAFRQR